MKCSIAFILLAKIVSSQSVIERITNGQIATPKQFPYQVGLQIHTGQTRLWCRGVLISDQWILTVAHCVQGRKEALVFFGAVNRTNKDEIGQIIVRVPGSNFIVHQNWNRLNMVSDIAAIKLPTPITLNGRLHKTGNITKNGDYTFVYQCENYSKWMGRIHDDERQISQVLQWITVPIISNTQCSIYYRVRIRDFHICVNTRGKVSTCVGDSGGPLVLADGSDTLVGLTSFGLSIGCETEVPVVFTRITSHLDWIKNTTGVHN